MSSCTQNFMLSFRMTEAWWLSVTVWGQKEGMILQGRFRREKRTWGSVNLKELVFLRANAMLAWCNIFKYNGIPVTIMRAKPRLLTLLFEGQQILPPSLYHS